MHRRFLYQRTSWWCLRSLAMRSRLCLRSRCHQRHPSLYDVHVRHLLNCSLTCNLWSSFCHKLQMSRCQSATLRSWCQRMHLQHSFGLWSFSQYNLLMPFIQWSHHLHYGRHELFLPRFRNCPKQLLHDEGLRWKEMLRLRLLCWCCLHSSWFPRLPSMGLWCIKQLLRLRTPGLRYDNSYGNSRLSIRCCQIPLLMM